MSDARPARLAQAAQRSAPRAGQGRDEPLTLAIEQSTAEGSVALLCGERVLGERRWRATRENTEDLFSVLPGLLSMGKVTLDDVRVYAVGLGPGSYTGLRGAVAAARAFGLPAGSEVYGVSSGEALAQALAEERDAAAIGIVGDARRGRLWFALFHGNSGELAPGATWELTRPDAVAGRVPPGALLATPDWDRLADVLVHHCGSGNAALIGERCLPTAAWVGRTVLRRRRRGIRSEPLRPIYLHPPVAGTARKDCFS